jgi:NAD(P)H dehydrogenase (quinone)
LVNMSQISARREAASNAARQHWIAERLLDRSALVTTHLRPTFFLEWINWTCVRRDTEGILRLPFADGRYPLFGAEELD